MGFIKQVKLPIGKPIEFYQETQVSVGKSQDAIQKMLYKFGAHRVSFASQNVPFRAIGVQWTMPAVDGSEVPFSMYWRVIVPTIKKRRNSKPDFERFQQQEQVAMRTLYHSLKSKLLAIQEGLRSFEFEFLADYQIERNGQVASLGDLITSSQFALPARTKTKADDD